ncbi:hypothetical protein CG723_44985 [Streptomyces sp. CB01635]|nr:hypothetical protein CG723_44985 [Streptomyces sp. CB01635]
MPLQAQQDSPADVSASDDARLADVYGAVRRDRSGRPFVFLADHLPGGKEFEVGAVLPSLHSD